MTERLRRWAPALALGAILLLGAALRVYALGSNPLGFFADEASFGYNAYTILHHGMGEHGVRFPLLFRAFGEYKLPAYIYGIVPFIAVLGLTETAVRLATAFFGTATIGALYLLGRALFRSRWAGLLAALVLAVEPWHVHYSRTGLGDIIAYPFFLTLGLALFLLGRERPRLWPVAAVSLAAAFYSYRGGWVFMPVVLAALPLLYLSDTRRHWRMALLSGGLFLLLLLPLGMHLTAGEGDRVREVGILSAEQRGDRSLWETYQGYFSTRFLFERGDDGPITRHYLPGQGELYWLQAPFLAVGLVALAWRPFPVRMLLVLAFALYPLGGILTDAGTISSRTIQGAVLFALLTALGMMAAGGLAGRLPRRWGRLAVAGLAGLVVAVGILQVSAYLLRYHGEYPRLSSGYWGWQWGPEEIVPVFVGLQDEYDELYLDGAFNAPYIFLRFYAPEDCAKCRIGALDRYDPDRRQLFALRPESLSPKYRYDFKEAFRYPDGQVAFWLVEVVGEGPE